MTVHIKAKPEDIAETVLMPGDPLRAKWAAEKFLKDPIEVNNVRGMLGYTGTWDGNPVTIHGSGMGMPSMSIYANELIHEYGARTLIRIGSCGAMQENVKLRDIVIAMTASSVSTPSSIIMRELNFSPCADYELMSKALDAVKNGNYPICHVGGIYSSDAFYDERRDLTEQLARHGCLAVEMEAAELYTVASRYGAKALAILTVSDHVMTGENLPSDDRERTFADMVDIALRSAF